MVRTYKRKTVRAIISEDAVKKAVKEVMNKKKSIRQASLDYNLTKSMLHKRIQIARSKSKNIQSMSDSGCSEDENDLQTTNVSGRNKFRCHQVFTDEEEQLLRNYFLMSSKIHYGLTYLQARTLAFQYAQKLDKAMPSNWSANECADMDWMQCFMKRHRDLSLRKPENTSLARATSFNKHNVEEFFTNLYSLMDAYKFKPEHILNFDETGITTVLQSPKIIAKSGKKQVGQAVSAERGELVSFCGIISAIGNSILPVLFFPRVKYKEHFIFGAPVGSLGLASKSGWMTKELFPNILEHVKEYTKCHVNNPILLLMDNHSTHITLQAIIYAKENGIVLLSFPPHCSHKLQPLDVGIYSSFKSACKITFNDWMLNHPGQTITIYNIPALAAKAYYKSFTINNIISGFSKTGIYPLNRLAFSEDDFASSFVTDRECINAVHEVSNSTSNAEGHNHECTSPDKIMNSVSSSLENNKLVFENVITPVSKLSRKISSSITPESICPYPKAALRKKKTSREKGKSRIYTNTPEKIRIEEIEIKKIKKMEKKIKKMEKKKLKDKKEKNARKRLKSHCINESTPSKNSLIHSFDSDLDVSDNELFREETPKLNLLIDSDYIGVNDFVLIRFPKQNGVLHYVGRVESVYGSTEFDVQFLRKKDGQGSKSNNYSHYFYFPDVKDMSQITRSEIVSKLPSPNFAGSTAHSASQLVFNVDFSNYFVK